MKADIEIKEKIINTTMDLITKCKGNINEITIRNISEKANVSVGLINYHFQTKENLINICVQKIIENVITKFKPTMDKSLKPIEKLKATVKSVADFLMANPSVSRISILGDYNKPQVDDNTMKTVKGFSFVYDNHNISDKNKKMLAFGLTSILQAMFLRKDINKELFGFDFYNKEERDIWIDFIVEHLFMEEQL